MPSHAGQHRPAAQLRVRRQLTIRRADEGTRRCSHSCSAWAQLTRLLAGWKEEHDTFCACRFHVAHDRTIRARRCPHPYASLLCRIVPIDRSRLPPLSRVVDEELYGEDVDDEGESPIFGQRTIVPVLCDAGVEMLRPSPSCMSTLASPPGDLRACLRISARPYVSL